MLTEQEFHAQYKYGCYGAYVLRQQELAQPPEPVVFDTVGFLEVARDNKEKGWSND